MNLKRVFPVLFFSLVISLADFAVFTLLRDVAVYNVAVSYLLTNLIFVFMAVKTGSNGVSVTHALLRCLWFLFLSPYPVASALCALAGGVLGEIVLLFVRKKRMLLPNLLIYLMFHLIYAMRSFLRLGGGSIVFEQANLLMTMGSVLAAFALSYLIARVLLLPKLKTAGIEK